MATTVTTTTTAIELESLPPSNASFSHRDVHPVSQSRTRLSEPDPVLEASRLADSTVPDGGYAWVVIGACAVLTWWFVGTTYCWGVLQAAMLEDGLSTPATLCFLGSLPVSLISVLAIVNSRVIRVLGTRWASIMGVLIMGVSEILSSFAVKSLAGLFVTGGALLGIGVRYVLVLVENSCSVTPADPLSQLVLHGKAP